MPFDIQLRLLLNIKPQADRIKDELKTIGSDA